VNGDPAGREALEELCRRYWEPVRVSIIHRGWPPQDAADLAQAFFLRVMERGILHSAARDRGKFRNFIQGVLNHFLLNERERQRAAKRGGGLVHVDLDEDSGAVCDADAGFDREWALAIMRAAVEVTARECRAQRGDEFFESLRVFIGGTGEVVPQQEAARRLGVSAAAFRGEVLTWRRRLRENLRTEVLRTVSAPHEADEEMNYIHRLLLAS